MSSLEAKSLASRTIAMHEHYYIARVRDGCCTQSLAGALVNEFGSIKSSNEYANKPDELEV